MEWVYPNLRGTEFIKAMRWTFWLFMITSFVLMAAIVGIKAGAISANMAQLIQQAIGPVISINMVVLIYLADQNRRAEQKPTE